MERDFSVPNFVQQLLTGLENGWQGICDELSSLLSFPIIIIDPLYSLLSTSHPAMNLIVEYMNEQSNDLTDNQSKLYKCQVLCNDSSISGICSAILLDNRIRGYIIVACGDLSNEEQKALHPLLIYASSLCSLEFQQRIQLKKEKQHFKEVFIYDLLYGNIKKKEEIISYGQVWGWDFSQPHVVIVFSLKDFDYYSEDQQHLDLLFYTIEKLLLERYISPIAIKKRGEVIVIYPLQETVYAKKRAEVSNFVEQITDQVKKLKLADRLATGVGRECTSPETFYRSYQESKVAFELGLLLNIPTPYFHDLGLERILYKHDLQDLKEFYTHVLGEIEEYDRIHDGDLMHTLETFSSNQYDVTKTADAMFLHRNTLRYRFKKIEEILDSKLDDMNVRLNITAALKIKQLRKF